MLGGNVRRCAEQHLVGEHTRLTLLLLHRHVHVRDCRARLRCHVLVSEQDPDTITKSLRDAGIDERAHLVG
jgi:hypothetical protein